ncbi:putative exo-beta-1,3-glucanase [Teratosphaeria nubilosa]|uniref:Putative exo-beta-1,3-glucanase n=1 Tax=Teratosphaeria nubilosa TaxID=161662 RepID=A0A6G1LH44_9PEZI|nr:putative exo-beta-1,3-glucanase [Teratosphaeria nubilosa]
MGDGSTDDTDAINLAISDGDRCGEGCDSSTVSPAIVYFPPGTYMVSSPIIMYYYTQVIGDANDLPTLKATSGFSGIGVLDSDVYLPYGYSWYTNQNNFYRSVRNFVIDITEASLSGQISGIHWQVAQATSLQNIVFNMAEGSLASGNTQIGIFMDNGSGGFMEDLIFNGGGYGFFSGNQQFTVRNLTFNGCSTGIFQNWNWVFLYKEMIFNGCNVSIDMSQGGDVPAMGSNVIQDSVFNDNTYCVVTSFSYNSTPATAGSFVLDNCDFTTTSPAIVYPNGTVLDAGGRVINIYISGTAYSAYEYEEEEHDLACFEPTANYTRIQQAVSRPSLPASLVNASGMVYSRSRPQYEGVPVANFMSAMSYGGCAGDGVTDDTTCVQNFLNNVEAKGDGYVAYFDHGAYVISDTIQVPNNVKMQGEIWPLFMVTGDKFQDQSNPQVAFRVGNPGDTGTTEMVEFVFESIGPVPGAIMMEWNLAGTQPTISGMWDVHWRMGGSNGTQVQSDKCTKDPGTAVTDPPAECILSYMLLHITETASLIMSNNWGWVSDHELDLSDHNQIQVYNGRGMLVESQGPVWMYAPAMEHSMLYNLQIAGAKDIYAGVYQSETQYGQDNPNALTPFTPNTTYHDPTFSECFVATCFKTFGLRIYNSTYIYFYGVGLYSFFDNWDGGCLTTDECQQLILSLEQSEAVYVYALNTVGAVNMVEVDQVSIVPASANGNTFADTVAVFEYP